VREWISEPDHGAHNKRNWILTPFPDFETGLAGWAWEGLVLG